MVVESGAFVQTKLIRFCLELQKNHLNSSVLIVNPFVFRTDIELNERAPAARYGLVYM